MALVEVGLDDKYRLDAKRIFLSGTQALVRLPMLQRERDRAQGLNTAGFISGYRGSPLGMYDHALGGNIYFRLVTFSPGSAPEALFLLAYFGLGLATLGRALAWVQGGPGHRGMGGDEVNDCEDRSGKDPRRQGRAAALG